jgi:hypothetical protein
MSRFFAVPVAATLLALVGIRVIGTPPPRAAEPLAIVVASPQEPAEPTPPLIVTAEDYWAPAPEPVAPPKAEPSIIVLEPPPQPAPEVRTEVIERIVYIPQQTFVYAPTTIVYPHAEAAPPPPQEVVETPVIVMTNAPHLRPVPPARRPKAQQDTFFKEIPFLPPTPKGPRWEP